jgi:retron-type reverse transcriptase
MIQVPALKLVYGPVSRKASANTRAVTNDNLDGISAARLLALRKELKNHSFRFKPIRRVHIPKVGGGKRPLGIPSLADKVTQKVACSVLEETYEGKGIFLGCSHGFRPDKSPHTALFQVKG